MKNSIISDDITLITTNSVKIDTNNEFITNWYWSPNISISNIIYNFCSNNCKYHNNRVLEIGPGKTPFPLATDFIGCNESITNYIDIDIDKDRFPFDDQTFDFIYCRHVLEDIQNPDFAFNEILRVSKSKGYIETPSPLIEITKNIDAPEMSKLYCGYAHHRYIVWSSIEKNEIYFLPKYSCILDNILEFNNETKNFIYRIINNYPVYWNNYFIYDINNKPKIIMYKNGVNFNNTKDGNMIIEYISLVSRAVNEYIENTNYFISNYKFLIDK